MLEAIKKIIGEQMGIRDLSTIGMESNLVDDLGCDSIDAAEIIIAIENEYEIEIPEEAIENISTVSDIIEYIESNK